MIKWLDNTTRRLREVFLLEDPPSLWKYMRALHYVYVYRYVQKVPNPYFCAFLFFFIFVAWAPVLNGRWTRHTTLGSNEGRLSRYMTKSDKDK